MTESVPIENLTIDDTVYIVDDLPQELQAAVRKYEDWRDRLAGAQDEVQLVSAAMRDLGAGLVRAIQEIEANAPVEDVNEDVSPDTLVVDDGDE